MSNRIVPFILVLTVAFLFGNCDEPRQPRDHGEALPPAVTSVEYRQLLQASGLPNHSLGILQLRYSYERLRSQERYGSQENVIEMARETCEHRTMYRRMSDTDPEFSAYALETSLLRSGERTAEAEAASQRMQRLLRELSVSISNLETEYTRTLDQFEVDPYGTLQRVDASVSISPWRTQPWRARELQSTKLA